MVDSVKDIAEEIIAINKQREQLIKWVHTLS
jgi:hypothetical protein